MYLATYFYHCLTLMMSNINDTRVPFDGQIKARDLWWHCIYCSGTVLWTTRPTSNSAHYKVGLFQSQPLQSGYENNSLIFIFMYKIWNHSILWDSLTICYKNAAWRSSMLPGNMFLAENSTFQICGLIARRHIMAHASKLKCLIPIVLFRPHALISAKQIRKWRQK